MVGVADQPARQLQSLAYFHPDADGGLLILGTGGSGKTVALRTLADQRRARRRDLAASPFEVHALDFAGRGLDVLEELPHVGSVISGDDTERVTRLLRTLRERIDQRAIDFAAVRASSLPEYRRNAPAGRVRLPGARPARQLPGLPGDARAHRRRQVARPVHPARGRRPPGRGPLRDHGRSTVVDPDVGRQRPAAQDRAPPVQRRRVPQRRRAGRHPVADEPGRAGDHRRHRGPGRRARWLGQRRAPGRRDRPARGAADARPASPTAPAVGVLPDEFRRSALDVAVDAGAADDRDRRPRPAAAGHPARPGSRCS